MKEMDKGQKIFIIVGVIVIVIGMIITINNFSITQTNEEYTHEVGQELVLQVEDFFDVKEDKQEKVKFDTSAVDVNTVGTYDVPVSYYGKDFHITVNVADTTKPMVEFKERIVFANDVANPNFAYTFEGIYDASEYTTKLIRFEHFSNLERVDDNLIDRLTDEILVPCKDEEMLALGTEEVPTEEGIYRAVLEIADVHGNARLEEVYLVLDKTGAKIEDVPDKVIKVSKDKLSEKPEVDMSDYTVTDLVDGKIKSADLLCELELRDEAKHEWISHVSYTDRAGNESKADFLITVKETTKKEETTDKKEESNSLSASNTGNTTTTKPIVSAGTDPADADGDGVVTGEEAYNHISVYEQAVIDAGYGVVVDFGDGGYGVMTYSDGYVNGVDGFNILDNYLANMGLQAKHMSGGNLGAGYDAMYYIAYDIVPLVTEDDPNFWVN